jgi:hypothetical protein
MSWPRVLVLALTACGDNTGVTPPEAPGLNNELTMFFRLEETGDIPRRDEVYDITIFPWKRLDYGVYHQDGIGTTLVPGVVGNGQHIAGADGYHFATYGHREMDHARGSFTWVGWASIDTSDYADQQTLLAKWASIPDTDVPPDRREYRVWFEPGLEKWRFEVSRDGLEGDDHSIAVTHPGLIERDKMYFIEAWHDAEAQSINLRVSDQVARGTVETVAWDAGVASTDADLDVGAQNQCADDHLQGTVDALGYWTRTLTDVEASALWNDGNGLEL